MWRSSHGLFHTQLLLHNHFPLYHAAINHPFRPELRFWNKHSLRAAHEEIKASVAPPALPDTLQLTKDNEETTAEERCKQPKAPTYFAVGWAIRCRCHWNRLLHQKIWWCSWDFTVCQDIKGSTFEILASRAACILMCCVPVFHSGSDEIWVTKRSIYRKKRRMSIQCQSKFLLYPELLYE